MNSLRDKTTNSSLSLTLNQRILVLYQSGMNSAVQIYRLVSRSIKVSKRTVERKVNRLKQGLPFETVERKTRNDKFLTEETSEEIQDYLKDHLSATAE